MRRLTLVLSLLALSVQGAIVKVQSTHNKTTTATFASNNTAGSLLVAISTYAYSGTAPTPAFTVSSGVINNLTSFTNTPNGGSSVGITVGYVMNATGGVKATFTLGTLGSSTDQGITIIEYTGIATSSAIGMTPSTTTAPASATTTPTSSSFTPTGAGNLLIATWADETTTITSITAGSGYAIINSDTTHNDAEENNLSSSSGSQTAAFTTTSSNKWLMYVVEFKAAAGGVATSGQTKRGKLQKLDEML